MENENKNCEHKGGCGKAMAIIAIILSVISIGISAFTLGVTTKNNKECPMPNAIQNCPMQNGGTCPMQDFMQKGIRNRDKFMPMWPINNRWRNNDDTATSSNAKRRIGGYSPFNKAYDKKPVQDIDRNQSPQEYKTFNAPDDTYGEKLKERERLRKEKRESMATRETDTY